MAETEHKCPCPKPIEGSGFSHCELFNCRMTQTWCEKCQTRPNWRRMYEDGRGPLQDKGDKDKQQLVREHNKRVTKDNACAEKKKKVPRVFRLGDNVEAALKTVGITSERVSAWLGRPCGCPERKRRLNNLGAWAHRVITGKTDKAEQYLEEIIGDS